MGKNITKNRISWIDMAKGYGILLVVLGHIGFGRFGTWIYSFHMPLFCFLSGYVFKADASFGEFILKKAKTILIPYFLIAALDFITDGDYIFGDFVVKTLVQERYCVFWFLAFLFSLNLLYYAAVRLTGDSTPGIIAATAVFVAVWLVSGKRALPWNIDAALFASPFFAAGYLLRKRGFGQKRIKKAPLWASAFLAVNIILTVLNVKLSGNSLEMFIYEYGFLPVTYLSAAAGIAFVVCLSMALSAAPLEYIGRNSIKYYGLHTTISMQIAVWLLTLVGFYEGSGLHLLAFKLVFFILIVLITTAAVALINLIMKKINGSTA